MKATYEELERKIAVLDLQLNLSLAAERAWETTMMLACGEDGPKSVADKFAAIEAKCEALAAENAGIKAISEDRRIFIMNGVQLGYIKVPTVETDPALETIRAAVSPQEPTPATDAFLAEVRAQGVEVFGQHHNFSEKLLIQKEAQKFADQLRKGGNQ